MNKYKINDEVIVIAGKFVGKTGKIVSINWKNNKVCVENVNLVKRTIKPSQENPNGGFADKLLPLDLSNVSLISPKTKKATKVKFELNNLGKMVRISKSCGSII